MSDIATTRIFSNGETGITASKLNDIVGQASIQTSFVSGQPLASSIGTTDQFLLLTSGGTYARVPQSTLLSSVSGSLVPAGVGQAGIMNALSGNTTDYVSGANTCINLTTAPAITLMRLRSFNALAHNNCTFEVDQRTVGVQQANAATGVFIQDRWVLGKGGTMTVDVLPAQVATAGNEVVIPGTSFEITRCFLTVKLATAQVVLGTGDNLQVYTIVEGSRLRELFKDVHSVSILCRSSVANLKFGLWLRDPPTFSRSLTKLCTLGAANTWTLITLPNIPAFPSAGNFSTAPGVEGYRLGVTLAAGSTLTAPANDVWQTGNYVGASGQDSFANQAVNSTFNIAFIQHEVGASATTLMDLSFRDNLDACLLCFDKSYDYATAVGTITSNGQNRMILPNSTTSIQGTTRFSRKMVKVPTVTIYNPVTGAINSCSVGGTATAVTGVTGIGEKGFDVLTIGAAAGPTGVILHHMADSGW